MRPVATSTAASRADFVRAGRHTKAICFPSSDPWSRVSPPGIVATLRGVPPAAGIT